MSRRKREAATASEQSCPRCGAGRDADQEYCIECGLRLPPVSGGVAALRRGWMRRIGWYPGDWIWLSLLALAAAAGAAAVAVALTRENGTTGTTTIVAPTPVRVAAQGSSASGIVTGTSASPAAKTTKGGRLTWPADQRGWTIVLVSYPTRGGRAAPLATAGRAAGLGLPEVGVLTSSDFSSLHPGYYVVFSGLYSSRADAEAALASARASGFGGAYTRQIAP